MRGPELVGNLIGGILQHGKRDVVDPREVREGGKRILLIRVDRHELHAFVFVPAGEVGKLRSILPSQRTIRPDEDDRQCAALFPFAQRMSGAERIFEGKGIDPLSDRCRAVGGRRD